MSTLKIKTVDEVAIELNSKRLPASGAIHPREIRDAFVADRAAIHTSLVAAVEGQKYELNVAEYLPKVKAWTSGYDQPFDDGYEQGKKDTLTIINSIFKE